MQQQTSDRGELPEMMTSPTTSTQNSDARWNLIHSLDFQSSSATDLRTSTSSSRGKLEVHNDDTSNNVEDDDDQDGVMSVDSNRSQQSRPSSVIGANDSCSFVRSSNYLEELVDCFRSDVEESLRRQQQALGSRQTDGDDTHSRYPTSTSSSCSTPSSTCELVSTLQNHFKSAAVAVATAAAAAAAAAAASASAAAPVSSNQISSRRANTPESNSHTRGSNFIGCASTVVCGSSNNYNCNSNYSQHHELIPLDLKMLPGYEIWSSDHEMRGRLKLDEEDTDEDELDLISIDNGVQHTEIVQTTMANSDEPSTLFVDRLESRISLTGATLSANSHRSQSPPKSNMAEPEKMPSGNRKKPNGGQWQSQQQPSSPANNTHRHHQHNKHRRLYKCRHCPFETDKKVENWQHIRVHMRPEKLLSCNSCLFVTEYKHHLEYHQRNHTGYKPFKCEHCDYTCVNKSMLNSHMKSHSSVYQYQCGDCKYATKYVHSLKMHLRKYNHRPAAMMIDIFGRKRGPKPGSGKKQQHSAQSAANELVSTSTSKSKSRGKQQQLSHQNCSILDLRVNSKLRNQ